MNHYLYLPRIVVTSSTSLRSSSSTTRSKGTPTPIATLALHGKGHDCDCSCSRLSQMLMLQLHQNWSLAKECCSKSKWLDRTDVSQDNKPVLHLVMSGVDSKSHFIFQHLPSPIDGESNGYDEVLSAFETVECHTSMLTLARCITELANQDLEHQILGIEATNHMTQFCVAQIVLMTMSQLIMWSWTQFYPRSLIHDLLTAAQGKPLAKIV